MTIVERFNLQRGKENKYISNSNNSNDAIDNFILAKEKTKKRLQEEAEATAQFEKEIEKQVYDHIEKELAEEIKKAFK